MSQSHYREFPPAPLLARLIECFWISTVPTPPRTSSFHRVLPDGCMDLLFDFTTVGSRRSSVIGTMTRALTVTTTGPVDLLGVRFRPGGLSAFLTLDVLSIAMAATAFTMLAREFGRCESAVSRVNSILATAR